MPNKLFATSNPQVPIANLSSKARIICKGEVVGVISKLEEMFDKPANLKDLENRMKHRARISAMVNTLHVSTKPKAADSEQADNELWGLKGAELPPDAEYKSEDLENLIDVRALPDHLKDKAWRMLHKQAGAFSLDGQLGSYTARVHI